jgi:hypothetical protein
MVPRRETTEIIDLAYIVSGEECESAVLMSMLRTISGTGLRVLPFVMPGKTSRFSKNGLRSTDTLMALS